MMKQIATVYVEVTVTFADGTRGRLAKAVPVGSEDDPVVVAERTATGLARRITE